MESSLAGFFRCALTKRALDEHADGAAGNFEDASVEGLQHFDEELDDAGRSVELAAFLPLAHGEGAEEVFVDFSEGVAAESARDRGERLEQLGEQAGIENLVALRQDAGHVRIVALDSPHGIVDGEADVGAFGEIEQVLVTRGGREEKNGLGVVGRGIVQARAAAGGAGGLFQLGPMLGKAIFGKAQKDEAEDGLGVFGLFQPRAGPELIGGSPEALFERVIRGVFFRGGDPDHYAACLTLSRESSNVPVCRN